MSPHVVPQILLTIFIYRLCVPMFPIFTGTYTLKQICMRSYRKTIRLLLYLGSQNRRALKSYQSPFLMKSTTIENLNTCFFLSSSQIVAMNSFCFKKVNKQIFLKKYISTCISNSFLIASCWSHFEYYLIFSKKNTNSISEYKTCEFVGQLFSNRFFFLGKFLFFYFLHYI